MTVYKPRILRVRKLAWYKTRDAADLADCWIVFIGNYPEWTEPTWEGAVKRALAYVERCKLLQHG